LRWWRRGGGRAGGGKGGGGDAPVFVKVVVNEAALLRPRRSDPPFAAYAVPPNARKSASVAAMFAYESRRRIQRIVRSLHLSEEGFPNYEMEQRKIHASANRSPSRVPT